MSEEIANHTIEVYKDVGQYILCRTVRVRNNQVFLKMKKVKRTEFYSL